MAASDHSRRTFFIHTAALCAALGVRGALAASGGSNEPAAAQWARIKRALSPKTIARCRKAADNLAPRMHALLSTNDWETRTVNAIVAELKAVGALPLERSPLDPKCAAETDAMRADARSTGGTPGGVTAAIAAAAATIGTAPVTSTILAAVLALIAAVIILIAHLYSQGQEQPAASKNETPPRLDARNLKRLDKLESDFAGELRAVPDCTLSEK
jgi:hypothetical protein